MTSITLNNGVQIPQLGFGTWRVDPDDAARVVGDALAAGYRHIDTAQGYGNERGVGTAIAASGLDRSDIFLTSKLNNPNHAPQDVRDSFEQSLVELGTDYMDLFLIHWPLPMHYDGDFTSTWKAMTELLADGRLRAAGVSNFEPEHLERIIHDTGIIPAVNQIEAHPYFHNTRAREASKGYGIAVEAWGPLGQGAVLGDPTIGEIAAVLGRTPAQVILRWHLQRGDIVFPKSMSADRMRENFDVFDFELGAADVELIDALDRGEPGRVGTHPNKFSKL